MPWTINYYHRDGGALVDATVKLSSADGSYGVKNKGSNFLVVNDGVDMTNVGTGHYTYVLQYADADANPGVVKYFTQYSVAIEAVYGGRTKRTTFDHTTQVSTVGGIPRGTAAWACDAVEAKIGGTVAAGIALAHVQAGYEDFLKGLDPRPGYPSHDWSFLKAWAEITVHASAASAGTGVYADGEITLRTDGGIFDAEMVGRYVEIEDYGVYRIASYTGANEVVLTVESGQSAATFATSKNVRLAGIYDLPTDFGYLVNPFTYMRSGMPGLQQASPEDIQGMWRDQSGVGNATRYAIVPQQFSVSTGQRWQLMVAPRPQDTRVWRYRYFRVPGSLTDTAMYFLGGLVHAETIKMGGVADRELLGGNKLGPMRAQYERMMIGSIEHDKMLRSRGPLSFAEENTGLNY